MIKNKLPCSSYKELVDQIENIRKDMLQTGFSKGLNHPLTISLSEELDELIVLYQNLHKK